MQTPTMNDHLVLITGKATTGKSASLIEMRNDKNIWYLNCENGKKLPFKAKFRQFTITDPLQIYHAFNKLEDEKNKDVHTVVIDSLTFMMDMFESVHVLTSSNTQQAWGEYANFFRNLMQQYVAKSTKNVIFTAHTSDMLNKKEMAEETKVKVKGSLMDKGIESFFTTVVSTKLLPISALEPFEEAQKALVEAGDIPHMMLNITDKERRQGFKYVFQTQITEGHLGERMRAPIDMWNEAETYIDNSIALLIERLESFYRDDDEEDSSAM